MVVVASQILGELPAREVVGAHHSMHDAGLFEDGEVAVHGALREVVSLCEDLRDREGSQRGGERLDERLAVGRKPLAHQVQPRDGRVANVVGTRRHRRGVYRWATTVACVNPTERFADLVQRPQSEIPLDVACFLIAAHAHPDLDVDAGVARVDSLAASLDARDASTLAQELFTDLGFAGNTADYGDPRNSYLDDVLERHLGIPITLSVLMIEAGRRRGISVYGVGMPGHFLVGARAGEWYDPFNGGARLDERACRDRFGEAQDRATFHPGVLDPVGPLAIVDRMLTNLQHSLIERDPARAAWPARLRLRIPGIPPVRRAELAALLGSLGHFSEAAAVLDAVARQLPGAGSDEAARAATRLRARAN